MKNSVDNLAKTLDRVCLGSGKGPEQLLFEPPTGSSAFQSLGDIPRYLFRVVSPRSAGVTNDTWARSESARQGDISSTKDIFSFKGLKSRQIKAFELTVHLQWYGDTYGTEDNFVSWTSSLLFAIQYIYYRHHHDIPRSNLNNIQLFVVDTSLFRKGTFMQDLELIKSFREFDRENDLPRYRNLKSLYSLRTTKGFYFGEYLSQGSLKIENKYQMIPANVLFDCNRLRRLQPAFSKLYVSPPRREHVQWASAVMALRKNIWSATQLILSSATVLDRLATIKDILDNIDAGHSQHGWRFPLGIYLVALIGPGLATHSYLGNDTTFFEDFQAATWGGQEDLGFKPFEFNIVVPNTMPELEHALILVRVTNKYHQLKEALDSAIEAESKLQNLYIRARLPEGKEIFVITDQVKCLRDIGEQLERKFRNIRDLCDKFVSAIATLEE